MAESFFDSMHTLKEGAKTGPADLKLSAEVRDSYVNAVHDLCNVLNDQLAKINALSAYGNAGWFASANQTRTNLDSAREELKRGIGDYVKYLNEFADTVTEVASRLIKSG